jgi:hypothetical protein
MGKNIANAGIKRVPRPNPEKRVSPEVTKATAQIIRYSMSHLNISAMTGDRKR